MSIEGVVEEVKQEVVKVAAEVKAEVEKVVEAVKPEVKKLVQELTTEEKLALREIELSYVKATAEISRLSQITKDAQKNFTTTVEGLVKKYVLTPAEWTFDNVLLQFKKL